MQDINHVMDFITQNLALFFWQVACSQLEVQLYIIPIIYTSELLDPFLF